MCIGTQLPEPPWAQSAIKGVKAKAPRDEARGPPIEVGEKQYSSEKAIRRLDLEHHTQPTRKSQTEDPSIPSQWPIAESPVTDKQSKYSLAAVHNWHTFKKAWSEAILSTTNAVSVLLRRACFGGSEGGWLETDRSSFPSVRKSVNRLPTTHVPLRFAGTDVSIVGSCIYAQCATCGRAARDNDCARQG